MSTYDIQKNTDGNDLEVSSFESRGPAPFCFEELIAKISNCTANNRADSHFVHNQSFLKICEVLIV